MNLRMLLLLVLVIYAHAAYQPVIGILTNPSDVKGYDPSLFSYFPASYVKWIESAGALVVPIHWDSTYDEVDYLLSRVNAVLFTGGDANLYVNNTQPGFTYNKFTDTASFIFNKIVLANKAGKYFPLIGTCQGFQLINYIASLYYEVLTRVNGDLGVQRLLIPTEEKSDILSYLSPDIVQYLQNVDGPYYSHNWSVVDSTYESVQHLDKFFKITAYGTDALGFKYIAIIEGKDFPIYAWQFHPEKHQFEFRSKASHNEQHIVYAQQMANFVISLAHKNTNSFTLSELQKHIIYNYHPINVFSLEVTTMAQHYLFNRTQSTERKDEPQGVGLKQIVQYM